MNVWATFLNDSLYLYICFLIFDHKGITSQKSRNMAKKIMILGPKTCRLNISKMRIKMRVHHLEKQAARFLLGAGSL